MKTTRPIPIALLSLAAGLVAPPAWADTLTVGPTGDHTTIQAAITAAVTGDTIQIAAGNYAESITLDKKLTLIGAGSDAGAGTVITSIAGDSKIGNINLTASGISDADPMQIQDLRVEASGRAGISVGRFTEATGTSVEYIKLDNVQVIGTNTSPSTEQERGLYVDLTSSLKHLVVEDCAFNNLTYGWYFQKQVSADTSTVQYVAVTNSTFNHNNHKGIYTEKLSDATFTGCTVADNGFDSAALPSYFAPWSAGVDVNLKAGSYANLTFDTCAVTGNATDQSKEGAGLAVKARDDGATYGAFPAAVDTVLITNCTITGNERGIRLGEPGKANTTPTNVTISNCDIQNNVQNYAGTDGSAYGDVINQTASTLAGLAPATALHNIAPGSSLQAAVDAALPGDRLFVANGTYTLPSTLNINQAIELVGESEAGVIIDASGNGTGYGIKVEADNVTLANFTLLPPVVPASLGTSGGGGFAIHASFNHTAPYAPYSNLTLEDITIENGNRAAFDIHGYDGLTLTNLTARNSAYGNGVQLTGCTDATVTGCTTEGNAWGGLAVYCSKSSYLNRPSSDISIDLAANSINPTLYIEDEFGLVNTDIVVQGATYLIDNNYNPGTAAMHMYTAGDEAAAITIAQGLNAKFSNTASTLADLASDNLLVAPGMTIQAAIDAAPAGGTVNIAAGTYFETGQIVIDKNLTITGAGAATVKIKPDHATSGGSYAQENGWFAVSEGATFSLSGVTLDGTDLAGDPQEIKMAILSRGSVTIEDCTIQNIASHVYLGWGVCIVNNTDNAVRRCTFSGIQRIGVHIRGGVLADAPAAVVEDCTYTGKGDGDWLDNGIEFGGGGSGTVSNCTITNCTGIASTDGSTSTGILATDYYGNGTDATVTGCTITDCTTGIMVGYADADLTVMNATDNSFSGCDYGVSTTPNAAVTASPNYWGAADGPSGEGPGTGDSVGTNVSYSPWWADEAMTILAYDSADFTGDVTVGPEEVLEIPETLTITGGTFLVDQGTLIAGNVQLAEGATLKVENGDLDLGDGSVISGTFTVFNSFGSWNINGDTTFNIGQSLALISEIHVAPGKTLTVNGGGELVLDGCVIDSQSPGSTYGITVETDGLLTVARCVATDAVIDINTLAAAVPANLTSRVYDSRLVACAIEASAGSQVVHNLLDAGTTANSDGTAAFDPVDGWANVTDAANLENLYQLGFQAPLDTTRTLDADGNLFVQSGDDVVVNMDVSELGSNTITTAEALLGYNSDLLTLQTTPTAVTPATGWDVIVEETTGSAPLGLIDSAIGLEFTGSGDDGISGPATIGTVNYLADADGLTMGFFRVQTNRQFNPDGSLVKDTRLTESTAGVPTYLAAFTTNTGELVIDTEAPAIAEDSVDGSQTQASVGTVDVLDPAGNPAPSNTFRNGNPVTFSFTATDAGLAGLDTEDVDNDLALLVSNGTTDLDSYTATAVETAGVVTYTVVLDVPATATNGTYAITASVLDRSGNESATADLGVLEIASELLATVELEGFEGSLRDVTFVATDAAGTALATWTKSVAFTGSTGSASLEDVPAATVSISAKTAWNLRSKVDAAFTPEGIGSADLTGTDLLPGGDINGDNAVNTLDYSILRYHWLTDHAVADISGNEMVTFGDYNLMRGNFYTVGDDQ